MQVPLLLGLGEEVKGLDKGLEAGDADLIYLALFQLWRSRPLPSFLQLLNARPLARALFFSYAARKVILFHSVALSRVSRTSITED